LSGTAEVVGLREGDLITGFDGVSIAIGEGDTTAIFGRCKGDGFGMETGVFSTGVGLGVFSTGVGLGVFSIVGSAGVSITIGEGEATTIGEGEATIRFGFG